jgi:hypothetical protein
MQGLANALDAEADALERYPNGAAATHSDGDAGPATRDRMESRKQACGLWGRMAAKSNERHAEGHDSGWRPGRSTAQDSGLRSQLRTPPKSPGSQ